MNSPRGDQPGVKPLIRKSEHRKAILGNLTLDDLQNIRIVEYDTGVLPLNINVTLALKNGENKLGWSKATPVLSPLEDLDLKLVPTSEVGQWLKGQGIDPMRTRGLSRLIWNIRNREENLGPLDFKVKCLRTKLIGAMVSALRELTNKTLVTSASLKKYVKGRVPKELARRLIDKRRTESWEEYFYPANASKWISWSSDDRTEECYHFLEDPFFTVAASFVRGFRSSSTQEEGHFTETHGLRIWHRGRGTWPLLVTPPWEQDYPVIPRLVSEVNDWILHLYSGLPTRSKFFRPLVGSDYRKWADLPVILREWEYSILPEDAYPLFDKAYKPVSIPKVKTNLRATDLPKKNALTTRRATREELVLIKRCYRPKSRAEALLRLMKFPSNIVIGSLRCALGRIQRRGDYVPPD